MAKDKFIWEQQHDTMYNVFKVGDDDPTAYSVDLREDSTSGTWFVGNIEKLGPFASENLAKAEYEATLIDD